ncbi:helix-turn-helix transcriptional regulator [Candidatus Formimonas warabiya]|uniref:Transcriptional regulator n=1 Tax=Formimonas warabiya TaxID=1761012 RepID=A0A3G1L0I4_FORW1|nr:helix-turn-helix transcriptional regulator [Candidatus Formimonas warabiya]ATW27995.1 hypothetical protein DCMF_27475 [Candidatus Formimonas warabiya]
MNKKEIIEILERIAAGISQTFGNDCEVLISDLNNPDNSIISIYNGHVTGRKVGDSLSELGLKAMKEKHVEHDLINYHAKTKDGRLIKCSTFHIKSGKHWLCLGINYDYTNLAMAHATLENLFKVEESMKDEFYANPNEILEGMISDAFKLVGKPASLMNKEDRIKVVKYLDERGALVIQKGVQIVAETLNVSRYTIYNYLNEINEEKKHPVESK